MKEKLKEISDPLLAWFDENKRSMPWRDDPSPYNVWLSEIMLQQTRVDVVRGYFLRFIQEIPSVEALANVPDQKLLKLWEGLGYYRRAFNLKKAAGILMEQEGGRMPSTYDEWILLPGIGAYTAGAIASIVFQEPVAAVDGNVLRVVARIAGDTADIRSEKTKRQYREELNKIIPKDRPGDFNQGLMELGALICLPHGAPLCASCPVKGYCLALREGRVDEIPPKQKKPEKETIQRTVLVIREAEQIWLRKRKDQGLLAGLYELPGTEQHMNEEQCDDLLKRWGFQVRSLQKLPAAHHIFTHLKWDMMGYLALVEPGFLPPPEEVWLSVTRQEIQQDISLPSAFSAYRPYFEAENVP